MNRDILNIGLDPILQFEVIARRKSLKEAAGELCLSQPAVTHALNKLEGSLGVKLCIRNRSTFALTESGKKLYATAQTLKLELKSFQSYLGQDDSFDGILSVGMLDNLHNHRFERALEKTLSNFPKMRLNLQVYNAKEIQRLVALGTLDVGIGIFNDKTSRLSYRELGEENISCFISEGHCLFRRKDLKKSDFKGMNYTWVDIISRSREEIETQILISDKKPPMTTTGYSNNLHSAVTILGTGSSVVPLPIEYLKSRNVSFKTRRLDDIFKPYPIKQSLVFDPNFVESSVAARFLVDILTRSDANNLLKVPN